jgi:hypothetical protein
VVGLSEGTRQLAQFPHCTRHQHDNCIPGRLLLSPCEVVGLIGGLHLSHKPNRVSVLLSVMPTICGCCGVVVSVPVQLRAEGESLFH